MEILIFILGFVFALVLVHFYPGLATVGAAVVKSCKAGIAWIRSKRSG
jgi:hypothetical protein